MDWKIGPRQKKASKDGIVGIVESAEALTAVYGSRTPEGRFKIDAFFSEKASTEEAKHLALSQFVQKHALANVGCVYVLEKGRYSLNLLDEPLVPEEEMSKAMQWLARDLIQFPIENAVIDTFKLPYPRARDNTKMIYTVITEKPIIAGIKLGVESSGLQLKYVDIPELAWMNVLKAHAQQTKGFAFMLLDETGGKFILIKNEQLCVTRSFEMNLQSLVAEAGNEKVLEALALEVQRSFDYMNSVFRQSIQNVIILGPTPLNKRLLTTSLHATLGAEVMPLSVSEDLQFGPDLDWQTEWAYWLAAGAALREEGKPV